MLTTSRPPRSEHVLAAAWASSYLREHGLPVATIKANGAVIAEPEKAAGELRYAFANEPPQKHLLAKLFTPLAKLRKRVAAWFTDPNKPKQLLLPAPKTSWQFENVRDSVMLDVALHDGRNVEVSVPFLRRDESMQMLSLSSAATLGAMVTAFPGLGNIALGLGVIATGVRGVQSYLVGNVARGNAAVRTIVKLAGLGVVDFLPFIANATLGATLLSAQAALERYRLGDGLIDTTLAEGRLRALTYGGADEPAACAGSGNWPLP